MCERVIFQEEKLKNISAGLKLNNKYDVQLIGFSVADKKIEFAI